MTKLNIGIIGAGMVAQEHIKNIKKINHARVAWLADLDTKLLGSYRGGIFLYHKGKRGQS